MTNLSKVEESREKARKIKESRKELLQEDEKAFENIVHTLSVEQIENMSGEELLEFNNFEEGKCYIGEPEFETQEELVKYIRSVMKYLVQSYEISEELDGYIKEFDDIQKDINNAFREYVGLDENASSIEVIQKTIEQELENAQLHNDTKRYEKILKSQETFNETFTLDRIKKLYKNLNSNNLKEDAKSERSVTIYKNYLKVQQKLGSRYDLIQVADLEQRFLPKEYHDMNNLFIIAVIKYISKSMKDGYYSSDTAFFVSQLTTNLFLLHLNTLPEEYKETLLTNIKEFLDIVR